MDVRARPLPQLRPLAPALARHRPGRGAAPLRRPGRPRPRQGRRGLSRPSATASASSAGSPTASRTPGTWAGGATACPGRGEVDFRRYLDTLYEGGFDGVLSVEHEDPIWGGTHGEGRCAGWRSRSETCGRWWSDERRADNGRGEADGARGPRPGQDLPRGRRRCAASTSTSAEGEVHCLLGPNGAGKSTLIKCVSGAVEPTAGEILVDGEPLPERDPAAALGRGVATIYQELDLVEDLSVAQNVFLGHEPRRGPLLDLGRMRERRRRAAGAARAREDRPAPAGAGAAPRRPAGRLDRPRALLRRPGPDHGRALGDPRRGRGRDPLRGRAPADRRGGRRRLHLPPARRDPADRRPGDGARRRRHRRRRDRRRHPDRRAGPADGRPQGRAPLPRAPARRRRGAARGARHARRCPRCAASASRCGRGRCSGSAAWSAPGAASCCG